MRDIPICQQWQTGVRSRLQLERGRWEAGLEDARAVLDGGAPIASLWPHVVIALVALRRGEEPELALDHLDRAWELAEQMAEPLGRMAVLSALAERAWLLDTDDERLRSGPTLLRETRSLPGVQWSAGNLAVWLRRLGRDPGEVSVAAPFASLLEGRAAEAAEQWRSLGAPYERALALVESPDEDVATGALGDLEAMGAWATADHHVSAVLTKLGLGTRREVDRRASELGLV